jgi:hypothetical protein
MHEKLTQFLKVTLNMYKRINIKIFFLVCALLSILAKPVISQVRQFEISDEQYTAADLVMGKDAEGYLIMVWTDYRNAWFFLGDDDEEGAVYGQIYDSELNPVGSNFRITEPIESGVTIGYNLDLLVLEDGRFVVTWVESIRIEGGSLHSRIVMTMLNRQGETLIPERSVNDHHEDPRRSNPRISRVPGNRFLITWFERREGENYRYGQYYDAYTGNPLGGNLRINPEGIPPQNIRQHLLSEDRYLLIYGARYMQYYDENDMPIGDPIDIVSTYNVGHNRLIVFHPFGDDSLMVLHWSLYGDQLWFSFANSDGTPMTEPVLINDNEPLQMIGAMNIAVNEEDGSFLLVWEDRRNSYPRRLGSDVADIYAQRYDESAQPVGANFKVNHEPYERDQLNPQILFHGDNHYLVSWWDDRLITCPDPDGGVIGNMMDAHHVGMYVDFDNPVPGPIMGWENWLEQIDSACTLTTVHDPGEPEAFNVSVYPNPFNNSTNIVFEHNYGFAIDIEVQIYDLLGRKIHTIRPTKQFGSGKHEITFNASEFSSGVYIARMTSPQVGGLYYTTKLLLIK